jgi:hypothetical protein
MSRAHPAETLAQELGSQGTLPLPRAVKSIEALPAGDRPQGTRGQVSDARAMRGFAVAGVARDPALGVEAVDVAAGSTIAGHRADRASGFAPRREDKVAGVLGFEPRQADPESAVLPLHYTPAKRFFT